MISCAPRNMVTPLYHTIRKSDGSWPYPFGDVKSVVRNGNSIGNIYGTCSCATNSAGDLHVLVKAGTGNFGTGNFRLYHTIRKADGSWPYPFGDVKNVLRNGNSIGNIADIACATNSAGDLHVLVIANSRLYHTIRKADGSWPYPFGDVQNVRKEWK